MHSGTTTKMLLLALTTAAGTAMAATGADEHAHAQSQGLPFLDSRLTADETTGPLAAASISAMKASQQGAARAAAAPVHVAASEEGRGGRFAGETGTDFVL